MPKTTRYTARRCVGRIRLLASKRSGSGPDQDGAMARRPGSHRTVRVTGHPSGELMNRIDVS